MLYTRSIIILSVKGCEAMNDTQKKVFEFLDQCEIAAVGTSDMGFPRQRMMHFAVNDRLEINLTSMKGDPKVIQWVNIPNTAILIHKGSTFMEMEECEIIGKAEIIMDAKEREEAILRLQKKSPIVAQFKQMGALDRLEFIKIIPSLIKYRYVPEILQGNPPLIIETADQTETNLWKEVYSKARVWVQATRPLSLTASFIPILVGGAMAFAFGTGFSMWLFWLTLIGGVLIQAGTNMINDWKDAEADSVNVSGIRPFTGGSRMIQLGLISRGDMGFVGILLSIMAFLIGLYLAFQSGWGILPLIVFGLLAGYFYTNQKSRFSFINLGPGVAEFFIATTYGVLMVLGTYYVQTGFYSLQVFLISLIVSFFIVNVLLINQFPDAEADAKSGKKTLVVRIGKAKTKNVIISLYAIGYISILVLPLLGWAPYSLYISFLTAPFAFQAMRYLLKNFDQSAADLIPAHAHTAIHHLFCGLLIVVAYLISSGLLLYAGLALVASVVLVYWVWNYIERQRRVMNQFRAAMVK